MVGTLPGRTQGLGLITEPLLRDLQIDRVSFARINLWATLIGALFTVGVGRLIDRIGSRIVLTVVVVSLAAVVFGMSATHSVAAIAILITLTRGFGQSALSVVSITMVGQWFVRRLNLAMAVYTVALSIGFMLAFPLIGAIVLANGWRTAWWTIGLALPLGLAPLAVYAAVMGLAGGFVIVIFFSFWSAAYGRKHLGKIQGAAQALTVIASALGPLVLAETVSRTGSYASIFYLLTLVVIVLALLAWFVKIPIEAKA